VQTDIRQEIRGITQVLEQSQGVEEELASLKEAYKQRVEECQALHASHKTIDKTRQESHDHVKQQDRYCQDATWL